MELLDILNENGQLTGQKEERSIVHEKNLWHVHVGVWIMNEKGELLLQKRSQNKKLNPNKWTRTGGHVDAGEVPLMAAQREVEEEIGIKIPLENLEFVKMKKQYKRKGSHFVYSYFALVNYKLEEYIMQKEEVSDLKYITIEEMQNIYCRRDEMYTFVNWDDIGQEIEYLKNKRKELIY